MTSPVKQETERWMLSTSLKGVPRIIKSENTFLRTMWLVAVILFLVTTSYNVFALVKNYLRYSITTSIDVQRVSSAEDLNMLLTNAPEAILCNLSPISSLANNEDFLSSSEEFLDHWNGSFYHKLIVEGDIHRGPYAHLATFIENWLPEQLGPDGYMQYIGSEAAVKLGHEEEKFIMSCRFILSTPVGDIYVPCSSMATISRTTSRDYYNCFRIHNYTYPKGVSGVPKGISVVMYLDEFPKPMEWTMRDTGVVVYMVQKDTILKAADRILLPPGTSTDIQYSIGERKRQPPPFGACVQGPDVTLYDLDDRKIAYSETACLDACMNAQSEKNCRCKLHNSARGEGHNSSLPFCTSLADGKEELLWRLNCTLLDDDSKDICVDKCRPPCHEIFYDLTMSTSKWPAAGILSTLDDVIRRRKAYAIKNVAYQKIFDIMEARRNASDTRGQQSALLQENFVRVISYISEVTVTKLVDEPKTTATGLLSSLGGTLNLFSGITCVAFVEILEVVYRYVKRCMQRGKGKHTVSVVQETKADGHDNQ